MEVYQAAFVAGFLGGVISGMGTLMIYISVTRFMFKKRQAKMIEARKKEIARMRHLDNLEMAKKKKSGLWKGKKL